MIASDAMGQFTIGYLLKLINTHNIADDCMCFYIIDILFTLLLYTIYILNKLHNNA